MRIRLFISLLSAATILLPLIIYLVKPQKAIPGRRWLFYFLLWSLFWECFFGITAYHKIHNLAGFYPYFLGEYLILFFLFSEVLGRKTFKLDFWNISAGLIVIFLVVNPFLIQSWKQYNSYGGALANVAILYYSFRYYFKTYEEEKILLLNRDSVFLIISSLFFFFANSFMATLTYNLAVESYLPIGYHLHFFKVFANAVKNFVLAYALWINRK